MSARPIRPGGGGEPHCVANDNKHNVLAQAGTTYAFRYGLGAAVSAALAWLS